MEEPLTGVDYIDDRINHLYPREIELLLQVHNVSVNAGIDLVTHIMMVRKGLTDNYMDENIVKTTKLPLNLAQLFSWADTPQGHAYWQEIASLI